MTPPAPPPDQPAEQSQIALEYARLAQEERLRLKELGIKEKELETEAAGGSVGSRVRPWSQSWPG
jgi:hypothetical protein